MLQLEDKIEDYLDGLLSSDEQQTFEEAMRTDKALANKVAITKEVNHTIATEAKLQAFQKTLSNLDKIHFPVAEKTETTKTAVIRPMKSNRKIWLIAASFLILVVSSILIRNALKSETIDNTALFAANYEPFNTGQRGDNGDLSDIENQALAAYTSKDFKAAIPLFAQLSIENPTDENLILQLGSAYLSTYKTSEAIAVFQKIEAASVNYQAAQWFLALAYLQNDEIEMAKKVLIALANAGERMYSTKAKKLLEAW